MSATDPDGFKSRRYSARPLIWSGFYVSSNSITDGYTITLRPVPGKDEIDEFGGGIHLSIESRLPHCVDICDPGPDTYAGFSPFTGPGLGASEGEPVSVTVETGGIDSTVDGTGVGQPGTLEGFVPIWGSGRAAVDDFQNGNWGWGTFNSVMAVSDVLLVKTAGTIVVKGAWKGGSHTWNATRSWLGRRGFAEKWQHVHHAIVSQQCFRGTKLEAIFNQPWNLRALEPPPGVTMDTWHKMIEGKLPGLNMAERWWYGMPDWFRYGQISVVGDTVTAIGNE